MTLNINATTTDELLGRVRELRAAGRSPKQIAQALGVRPAAVAPLVRALAEQAVADDPERGLVGCWVNRGWRQGLSVDGHPEWPDTRHPNSAIAGIVSVAVARRRSQRLSVCGYLVDVYCLGVKNALGPRSMDERDLPAFLDQFFSAYAQAPLKAPLDLARHLVWGGVDYAAGLGFRPHPDFKPAAPHLGPRPEANAITFGRNGEPFYMQGPYDDPAKVLRTLSGSAGAGKFGFSMVEEVAAGW